MTDSENRLRSLLPAIYHESPDLKILLEIIEAVLFAPHGEETGPASESLDPGKKMPLALRMACLPALFDAFETPSDFLPWLAEWVALSHLEGLEEDLQRQLLAQIVPLYALRGTKHYVEALLGIFKPQNTEVRVQDQDLEGFKVGFAKLDIDSRLAHDRPFWFEVTIAMVGPRAHPEALQDLQERWEGRIRRVVDLAKPAHTLYELKWRI